jgi:hypothetical protein
MKLMTTNSPIQLILPFQRERNSQVEAGAIIALAEQERMKEKGLINKQFGEKVSFIIKGGYPLYLYCRNGKNYLFDGFNNSDFTISYPTVFSSQALKEDLQAKGRFLEDFIEYLSSHQKSLKSFRPNTFPLKGLINRQELRDEFSVCRKEANKILKEDEAYCALFKPFLSKEVIDNSFSELDCLQSGLKQEINRLNECFELIKQKTSEHKADLDFHLTATIEEANAKISACEEVVNPEVARISRTYKRRILSTANSFDKKISELESRQKRSRKSVDKAEEKISDYRLETQRQASYGHYYERRWAKKFARLGRELNRCERELERIEARLSGLISDKGSEVTGLGRLRDSQIDYVSQPLYNAQIQKAERIRVVQQQIQKLLNAESDLIDAINNRVKDWVLDRSFESLSLKETVLSTPVLVFVPFYLICYQSNENKRLFILSPASFGAVNFSAKVKGVFGYSKIKELMFPRFQTLTVLVSNVLELSRNSMEFVNQLTTFATTRNLLSSQEFKKQAQEGIAVLKQEGWLSDKEQEHLGRLLTGQ